MKNYLLSLALLFYAALLSAQSAQNTITILTSGGDYTTEKWVNVVNSQGVQVWGQGNGTYGDSAGLINEDVTLNPGTYIVNCYDRYDDGWDGTVISVTSNGALLGNNGGISPDDGVDADTNSSWENPDIELEASFTIEVSPPPSCPVASNFSENNVLNNTATLNWNPGGSENSWTIEYGEFGFQIGSGTSISTSQNTYILTGLSPNTDYDYYVRSNCGSEVSNWSSVQDFKTIDFGYICELALPISSLPYQTNDNTSNYEDNYDGSAGISCGSSSSYLDGDDVVYTYIPNTDGCINIKLSNLSGNYAGIFLYEDCSLIGNTCMNGAVNLSDSDDLTINEQSVSQNIPVYILISTWASPQSVSYTLEIEECASCIAPYNIMVDNITSTSAEVSWTPSPNISSWNLEYGTSGFSQGSGTLVSVSQSNYSITDLDAGASYDFYIQSNCGSELSTWSNGTFTTQNPIPTCGGKFYDSGGASGDYSIDENIITTICPSVAGEMVAVEFVDFHTEEDFDILIAYDGNSVSADFIDEYTGDINVGTVTASNSSGCLTFHFISDDYYSEAGWDANVLCGTPSNCITPTNINTSSISENSALINWTAGDNQSSWNIEYGITGFNLGSGTQITTSSKPYTISSLSSNTEYDIYVQAACSDENSSFSTVHTFTTNYTAPPNNICDAAEMLTVYSNFTETVGTNLGSTASGSNPLPACSNFGSGQDVWYAVVVPSIGNVTIECKSNGEITDLAMQVYTGNCSNLSLLECSDDDGDGLFPMVELSNLNPNETLYVRVFEYGNDNFGSFKISAYVPCPISSASLINETITIGSDASCDDNNWTYYQDGSFARVFAINWGLYNDAAKDAAVITLTTNNPGAAMENESATFTMGRYWNVDIGNEILAAPVSVKFYYDTSEKDAIDQLAFDYAEDHNSEFQSGLWFKTEGTTFDPSLITASSVGQGSFELPYTEGIENNISYVIFDNIQSFSGGGFAAGAGQGASPLPIDLLSLDVEEEGAYNVITWTTASEKNSELTRVQRSNNGKDWKEVDFVYNTGSARGDSYKIIDDNPFQLSYYRLETIDYDGSIAHSHIVQLKRDALVNGWDLHINPNPTNHSSILSLNSLREETVEMILTDISGKLISTRKYDVNIGVNDIRIDISDEMPGTYLVKISSLSSTEVMKLVKF